MPHAESDMTSPATNGEKPAFQTISHIKSYPVVSDSLDYVKSNPYGAKAIETADAFYAKYGKAVEPHLQTPYSYAKPYVEKADSLGDAAFGKLDTTFPIVKEDTATLIDTGKSYVFYPIKLAGQGKEYVFSAWEDEYNKTASRNDRGPGLVTTFLAGVSTILRIEKDSLDAIHDYLAPKKDEAKEKYGAFVDGAKKKKDAYANDAKKKYDQFSSDAKGTADSYADKAKQTKDEAAAKAQEKSS